MMAAMRAPLVVLAGVLGLACSETPRSSPAATAEPKPARAPLAAGPAVGEPLPPFDLPDQDGRLQRFDRLRGPAGLVLNFNRSVVW